MKCSLTICKEIATLGRYCAKHRRSQAHNKASTAVGDLLDYDYWYKLSPEEKEFLIQFNSEFYFAKFSTQIKSLHRKPTQRQESKQDLVNRRCSILLQFAQTFNETSTVYPRTPSFEDDIILKIDVEKSPNRFSSRRKVLKLLKK